MENSTILKIYNECGKLVTLTESSRGNEIYLVVRCLNNENYPDEKMIRLDKDPNYYLVI